MSFSEYFWFPFRLLDQALSLGFEGNWWLRNYERKLIEIASQQLDPENKAILMAQLAAPRFVSRLHKDRVTHIHFQFPSRVPQMNLPPDYGLARMKVKSAGGSTWVSVGTDTGHIFFLQYKDPPKPIFAHPFEVEKITYGGTADQSVAKEIHNEEHGWTDPL